VHAEPGQRWAELDLVRDWQEFLPAPDRWLRHLAD
jgi:hypothetical protein